MVVVVLAGLVVACGNGDDGSSTPSSAPPSTTAASTTTAASAAAGSTTTAPGAALRFGTPVTVTEGYLVASSPDGSALYVERVDDELSERGCEGAPEPVLFRVDVEGGASEPVQVGGRVAGGYFTLARGPDGRVALIGACEDFVQSIWVGTESAEGRLTGLREVPLDALSASGSVTGAISWAGDGTRLLAGVSGGLSGPARAVAVDPTTGEVTDLFAVEGATQVGQVAQLADGTYVVSTGLQVSVRDGSGTILAAVAGQRFAVAPGGGQVGAFGEGVQILLPGRAQPVPIVGEDVDALDGTFSPDGRTVAYLASGPRGASLHVATVADGRSTAVPGAEAGFTMLRPRFTGDGRALAFTILADAGTDQPPDANVVVVALE